MGQEFTLDESIQSTVGHLINNVRPTALALTVFAQFADPISSQVIKLINRPNFRVYDAARLMILCGCLHSNNIMKILTLLQKYLK